MAVCALTLALGACQAIRPISDPDFWWHLQGGKDTVARGRPPTQDRYTLLSADRAWVYDSWLSGSTFYGLYAVGGFGAVSLAMAGVYTLALAVGIVRCRRRGARLLSSCLAALVACWVLESQLVLVPRPFLFALLWTNVALVQLDRWRGGNARDSAADHLSQVRWWRSPLALLVPIAILWVNGHASWPMLFALLAAYGIDAVLKWRWRALEHRNQIGRAGAGKQWALFAGLAAAALLINPYGPALLRAPYQILFATRWLSAAAEWQATGFAPAFVPFWVYAALSAGGLAVLIRRREGWLADAMLFVLLGGMTLVSYRHVLFFVPALLPACAVLLERSTGALDGWLRRLRGRASRAGEGILEKDPRASVPVAGAASKRLPQGAAIAFPLWLAAVAAGAWQLYAAGLPQLGIRQRPFPVKATAFLQAHAVTGPIFNQEDWAGYLLWHLYPQCRVYIDSRFTVHSERTQTSYFATYCGLPGWPERLHREGVDVIVIAGPDRSGVGQRLVSTPGWVTVYWDDRAVVLVHGASPMAALAAEEDWSLSNPYFLEERVQAGGPLEELREQLARKVRRDPDCGTAWFYLGRVHLERKRLADAEEAFARSAELDSPYRRHAQLFLAATLLRQGRSADAADELARLWPARAALPPEAQHVLVELLDKTGQPPKAVELQQELNRSATDIPSRYRRRLRLARDQWAGGHAREARALLLELAGHPEVAAEAHLSLGLLAAEAGEPESEIDYQFARALSYRPPPPLADAIREEYRRLREGRQAGGR